ncbi:MAG: 50S ribosomal protein L30 [Anaerolineae bacterium]|nr:50S ribosomal protein L30 [Anaerolineae bacterium]
MSAGKAEVGKTLRITYVKSAIGYSQKQKATIRALGLHRLGDTVEHLDTPPIRGMIDKVSHLVVVEEIENEVA